MRLKTLTTLVAGAMLAVSAGAQAAIGPSTTTAPYQVGLNGWGITSILTVGDSVNLKPNGVDPYRLVGLVDGLGAFDNGDGTFTVLVNHEIRPDRGIAREHNITGGKGAFVSEWVIRKSDLRVLHGGDLIKSVYLWDDANKKFTRSLDTSFNRFCSADLPPTSAFYNSKTGKGYNGLIFMNGEEADDGRAFAHIVTGGDRGTAYELAYLGKFAWENALASPKMQDKTIVMGMDDDGLTDSQVYMYVGEKQKSGNAVMQAGLVGGKTYGLQVVGAPQREDAMTGFGGSSFRFAMIDLGYANGKSEAMLETQSDAAGVSQFRRVEDGHWDTLSENVFYFVTTADINTKTRLWKLTFDNIANPEAGGTIDMLIDGGAYDKDGNWVEVKMFDNMTVNGDGHILIQEDSGNQDWIGKTYIFDPVTKKIMTVSTHDPALFTPGLPGFITKDEEASGIIEVTHLFEGVAGYDTSKFRYYLVADQVHKNPGDIELVDMGQLQLMAQPVPEPETYALMLAGLGLIGFMARRRKAV